MDVSEPGFRGLRIRRHSRWCWLRRLFRLECRCRVATIQRSRYAPGTEIPEFSFDELESAYEEASWGDGEPSLSVMSPRASVLICRKFNPDATRDLTDQQVFDKFIVECKSGNVWIDDQGLVWMRNSEMVPNG